MFWRWWRNWERAAAEVVGGGELEVIDAGGAAAAADVGDEGFHGLLVGFAEGPGFGEEFFGAFDVFEEDGVVEGEVDFFLVEDVEDEDVVALVLQASESFVEGVEITEEIGDENDDTAGVDLIGDFEEDGAEVGGAVGFGGLESVEDLGQLGLGGRGAEPAAFDRIEKGQTDGIALLDAEHGEGGGEGGGIIKFCHAPFTARGGAAVFHGGGGIDEEGGAEVGFLFVAFDVVAVGAGVGAPVEAFEVITGGVLAVVGELDALAVEGRAMEAGHGAFHDTLGAQSERDDPGEDLRL